MTSRIKCATSGAEVRNRVSVHPVQSWKCSQITDGRFVLPIAAASSNTDFLPVSANPAGAVTISMLHNWRKLLRETPLASRCSAIVGCIDMGALLHTTLPGHQRRKLPWRHELRLSRSHRKTRGAKNECHLVRDY